MKTMLLWKRARARTWKMQGTATAVCSASTIDTLCRMAEEKKGRFAIVHAETAAAARHILRGYEQSGQYEGGMVTSRADGRILAFGLEGARALAGTAHAVANWDRRIREQGKVTEDQSRALRSDVDPDQFLTPEALLTGSAPNCPAVPPVTYRENLERDGIELKFESRPERALLDAIKGAGFRWSRRQGLWYAKRSDDRKKLALAIVKAGGAQ